MRAPRADPAACAGWRPGAARRAGGPVRSAGKNWGQELGARSGPPGARRLMRAVRKAASGSEGAPSAACGWCDAQEPGAVSRRRSGPASAGCCLWRQSRPVRCRAGRSSAAGQPGGRRKAGWSWVAGNTVVAGRSPLPRFHRSNRDWRMHAAVRTVPLSPHSPLPKPSPAAKAAGSPAKPVTRSDDKFAARPDDIPQQEN